MLPGLQIVDHGDDEVDEGEARKMREAAITQCLVHQLFNPDFYCTQVAVMKFAR